jgi:hypothetical protein
MSKILTSVEWLEDMIKNMVYNGADFGDDYPSLLVHIEKAKQMHEEEIIDAHIKGHNAPSSTLKHYDAKQYYNETYKPQEDTDVPLLNKEDNDKD